MKNILLLLLSGYLSVVHAHGMVHEQIHDLSQRMEAEPNNTELYLKRGRLYIEEEHYDDAQFDFEFVLKLDKTNRSAHYYLGRIALLQKHYPVAIGHARNFIVTLSSEQGGFTRGYRLLGAAYNGAEDYKKAAKAFQLAIDHSEEPRPAFFLDLAHAYQQQEHYVLALEVLSEGEKHLGALQVFQDHALELEIISKNYNAALKRLDQLIANGKRLPIFYEKKGRVLAAVGRVGDSKIAYQSALTELNKLPIARQNSQAMLKLKSRINVATLSLATVESKH